MKILSLNQIKKIDQYCIDNEYISSIELMERAAKSCFYWIMNHFHPLHKVIVLAGNGKNGGDGLALARMLYQHGVDITVYILYISNHLSPEFVINKNKIFKYGIELKKIKKGDPFPFLNRNSILIDAIFGIGLNRSINKYWKSFFHFINDNKFTSVISIDIPSGIFMEKNREDLEVIIKADYTLTFQVPKLPFFFSRLCGLCWKMGFIEHWMER